MEGKLLTDCKFCGNCHFTDGMLYTSSPPKVRCNFTGEFHNTNELCSVELEPVVHGNWSLRCETHADTHTGEVDEEFYLECSECKRQVWGIDQNIAVSGDWRKLTAEYPYCHCGTKMNKGEEL